jgi:hypothetical protein
LGLVGCRFGIVECLEWHHLLWDVHRLGRLTSHRHLLITRIIIHEQRHFRPGRIRRPLPCPLLVARRIQRGIEYGLQYLPLLPRIIMVRAFRVDVLGYDGRIQILIRSLLLLRTLVVLAREVRVFRMHHVLH